MRFLKSFLEESTGENTTPSELTKPPKPGSVSSVSEQKDADTTEGRIIAYQIASKVLGVDIWFALDDSFEASDGLAVFCGGELEFLATKDAEQLRQIHKVKLAFPGSRVRQ